MTVVNLSVPEAGDNPFGGDTSRCAECGDPLEGNVVRYDLYLASPNDISVWFHPACAVVVGNRLISDGYPNRLDGQ